MLMWSEVSKQVLVGQQTAAVAGQPQQTYSAPVQVANNFYSNFGQFSQLV